MERHPRARIEGMLIETLDEGLVLYDQEIDQAHSLSPRAARVWSTANGQRTVVEIAEACQLDEATAVAALGQLEASGLLVQQPGVSRRSMLRRAAVAGAGAVVAAPLVETVLIPTAAAHASTITSGGGGGGGGGTGPKIVPSLSFSVTGGSEYFVTVESGPQIGDHAVVAEHASGTFDTGFGGRIQVTNNVSAASVTNQGTVTYQVIDSDAGSTPATLSPGQTASFPTSPGAEVQISSEL